jgi:hypothetical protein
MEPMEPELKLTNKIPDSLNKMAVERAVANFVAACDMNCDPSGFYNNTIQRIAAATFLNQPGQDFWLAEAYGEVAGYALASVVVDFDTRLTYLVAQSWVDPIWRGHPVVKQSWEALRERAKKLLCQSLQIVSCRNPQAECRWLGGGMQVFSSILKQELGAATPKGVANGLYT